ncbi:MAG: oligosaccharide flippase family protein [Gammaproteobacteria bacterium]|nr:oligosaccharide flippase family protein [Gammaproteobacteria bacterium]
MSEVGARSILVNTLHLAGARGVGLALRVVYIVMLTRSLGPELFGVFTYAQNWYIAILPVCTLGMGVILAQEIGRQRGQGAGVLHASLGLFMLMCGCAVLLQLGLGQVLEPPGVARDLIVLFSVALVGRGLVMWTEYVFSAYEAARNTLAQESLFRPLEIVLIATVLLLGGDLRALALTHGLLWWTQACRGLWLVHSRLAALRVRLDRRSLALFRQGVPIAVLGMFILWSLQAPMFLARHGGFAPVELGQLALAISILLALNTVARAFAASALPVLSRSVSRADDKDLDFVVLLLALLPLPGVVLVAFADQLGPWLTSSVFGARYLHAGEWLDFTAALLVLISIGDPLHLMLIARGRRPVVFRVTVLCFVLELGLWKLLALAGVDSAPVLAAVVALSVWIGLLAALSSRLFVSGMGGVLVLPLGCALGALLSYYTLRDAAPVTALLSCSSLALFGTVAYMRQPSARIVRGMLGQLARRRSRT